MKFFFDNNLAAKLAHGLNEMVEPGHQVVHLRDKFAPNVEDVVWMKALAAEEDWVIITADVRIVVAIHMRFVLGKKPDIPFFLKPGWTDLTFCWNQANKFTKCFPQVIAQAERAERAAAFVITVNGRSNP